MNMKVGDGMKLTPEMLSGVSGGTTNPADLDLIIRDFKARNPGSTVEDLMNMISDFQSYAIETDGDVRPFRFYYDPESKEMQDVMGYLEKNF